MNLKKKSRTTKKTKEIDVESLKITVRALNANDITSKINLKTLKVL